MATREIKIANTGDLRDGEMKKVSVHDTEVLLVRIDGSWFALGAKCPHYGAPLEEGTLAGGRIICPWHHSIFDAKTGDLLGPPSLDHLCRFELRVEGENIFLTLPEKVPASRPPARRAAKAGKDSRTFVIVGAGAAGNAAAQTLREDGFSGRVVMITKEMDLPYDRPNLSKLYMQGEADPSWIPLRPEEFYRDLEIEAVRGGRVTSIDANDLTVRCEDGRTFAPDRLLIATGGAPKMLEAPGAGLERIFTLRSLADADRIIDAAGSSSRAVVIGSSFIGTETAFSLRKRGLDVTVVSREAVPFEKAFGKELGGLFKRLHEKEGMNYRTSASVARFEGDRVVRAAVLEGGEKIDTDLVVVGIGVVPATGFLKGIELQPDGGLRVDDHFRVKENLFAAGDIAWFPDRRTGEYTRIEHWRTAEQQGTVAAHNMCGQEATYRGIPFFWTTQAGLDLHYLGHAPQWDDTIVDGDLDAQEFIVYFVKDGAVRAVAGNKRDTELGLIHHLMLDGKMPSPRELRDSKVDMLALLAGS
jgi:NADPH-dependent 2,4-dienoyl-CoA reductase/sulfur reductase-like enzyme/nitrite reductase/ring-hydroxylating ferredoxin subunit